MEYTEYTYHLVYNYMATVNSELAAHFKKKVKLTKTQEDGAPALEDLVKHFQETCQQQEGKRKVDISEDVIVPVKKQKVHGEKEGNSVKSERKKLFIRNVSKELSFSDIKDKVEKFGEVTEFSNSGKGFCFLTFTSADEACACVAGLNNTEIAGKTVQLNIAWEKHDKANNIEGCKLFVHGVKQETVNQDLEAEFAKFGTVTDSYNPGKGFAFVTMSTPEEASAAVEGLNEKEVCGNKVSINVSKPKERQVKGKNNKNAQVKEKIKKDEGLRLFVNNVDENLPQEELKAAFSVHGTVTDSYNTGKGYAFVNFSTKEEAKAAVDAVNGKEVCGREVECNVAQYRKAQKGRARRSKPTKSE